MLGLRDPFFNALGRRIAVVVMCLGWAALELNWGTPGWAGLFAAIGVYAGYVFFLSWTPIDTDKEEKDG